MEAPVLPYVASTTDVAEQQREELWRSVFSGLWGAVDVRRSSAGFLEGSLHSRKIGALTFNRIKFGHQSFERSRTHLKRLDSPFYSLTFPEYGAAVGRVGNSSAKLEPGNVYLLNTGLPSELKVEQAYSTFNILIATADLERRLGRQVDLFGRSIEQPSSILEITRTIISELSRQDSDADPRAGLFLSEQLLDLVAYYLLNGGRMSEDTLAKKAARENVDRYIERRFSDPRLSPEDIARDCGISRSYLYRLFSDDVSVMEKVRIKRLQKAYGSIVNNHAGLTLTQIAMNCGFASSSEFSRLFKAHFGTPPSKL